MRDLLLVVSVVAAVGGASAAASRVPSSGVRAALVALEAKEKRLPSAAAGCARYSVRVSSVDPKFASVTATFPTVGRCARWASNGYLIASSVGGWHVAYVGSGRPECWLLVPRRVLVDLTGWRCQR